MSKRRMIQAAVVIVMLAITAGILSWFWDWFSDANTPGATTRIRAIGGEG